MVVDEEEKRQCRCRDWSHQKVKTEQVSEVFLSPNGLWCKEASTAPSGSGQSKTPSYSQHLFFLLRKKEKQRHTSARYNHNLKNKATGILW